MAAIGADGQWIDTLRKPREERNVKVGKERSIPSRLPFQGLTQRRRIERNEHQARLPTAIGLTEVAGEGFCELRSCRKVNEAIPEVVRRADIPPKPHSF